MGVVKDQFKTNLFLSNSELDTIAQWKYKVKDNSLTTYIMTPVWDWLLKFIPQNVAPNVLTLAALGCVLQAFWVVLQHGDEFPRMSAVIAAGLTYAYFTLDALDGKHARLTKNGSPLGELFDHGCDNVGAAFQVVTMLKILGWNDPSTQWYLVQVAQLLFLSQHVSPYNSPDRTIRFGLLTGPGEALHIVMASMALHGLVGRAFLWDGFVFILRELERNVIQLGLPPFPDEVHTDGAINAEAFLAKGSQLLYFVTVGTLLLQLLNAWMFHTKEGNRRSGRALLICLSIRTIPAIVMYFSTRAEVVNVSMEQTISDGVFLSILSSDIIVAKVADRPIHGLVVVMTMASIMSNFAIYASLAIYYITVFSDIAQHMNLPMFNTVTNIYCDGIFDLLHRGHMEQFRQAHSVFPGGTRLFVGVCNDEDTCGYKRPPIMSEKERYAAVASCKYVHKVIEASPIVHATSKPGEEKTRSELMVEKYNIHYFAIGREYENVKEGKKDYYALAKERGMALYTERTGGISTSELIQRIARRAPEFLED